MADRCVCTMACQDFAHVARATSNQRTPHMRTTHLSIHAHPPSRECPNDASHVNHAQSEQHNVTSSHESYARPTRSTRNEQQKHSHTTRLGRTHIIVYMYHFCTETLPAGETKHRAEAERAKRRVGESMGSSRRRPGKIVGGTIVRPGQEPPGDWANSSRQSKQCSIHDQANRC